LAAVELPGRSLVPWMRNAEKRDRAGAVYFQEVPHEISWVGLRSSEWKYLRSVADGVEASYLIDLQKDPGETRNVVSQKPEVAAQLNARLDAWLARQQSVTPSSLTDMSEKMKDALREAGYLRDDVPPR